jgi:hypothetical protein
MVASQASCLHFFHTVGIGVMSAIRSTMFDDRECDVISLLISALGGTCVSCLTHAILAPLVLQGGFPLQVFIWAWTAVPLVLVAAFVLMLVMQDGIIPEREEYLGGIVLHLLLVFVFLVVGADPIRVW